MSEDTNSPEERARRQAEIAIAHGITVQTDRIAVADESLERLLRVADGACVDSRKIEIRAVERFKHAIRYDGRKAGGSTIRIKGATSPDEAIAAGMDPSWAESNPDATKAYIGTVGKNHAKIAGSRSKRAGSAYDRKLQADRIAGDVSRVNRSDRKDAGMIEHRTRLIAQCDDPNTSNRKRKAIRRKIHAITAQLGDGRR